MTKRELESRHEILLEEYAKKVLATAEKVGVFSGTAALKEALVELGSGLDQLKSGIARLDEALHDGKENTTLCAMQALRTTIDALERKVADKRWPLPKYRDMLFLY